MPLMPCRHCGINFMNADFNPDSKKLCNNCLLKEPKQSKKGFNMKEEVQILLTFPRQYQIEVEEICINEGINFSDYFVNLHKINTLFIRESAKNKEKSISENVDLPRNFGKLDFENEGVEKFEEKFENMAQVSPPKKKAKK